MKVKRKHWNTDVCVCVCVVGGGGEEGPKNSSRQSQEITKKKRYSVLLQELHISKSLIIRIKKRLLIPPMAMFKSEEWNKNCLLKRRLSG